MSINEEYELKTILYENLELFDLIDKYVGRQEEKKGWFWGGEGEDKNQSIEDNYGKILLLILKGVLKKKSKNLRTIQLQQPKISVLLKNTLKIIIKLIFQILKKLHNYYHQN